MRKHQHIGYIIWVLLLKLIFSNSLIAQVNSSETTIALNNTNTSISQKKVNSNGGIYFIENKNQWDSNILFKAEIPIGTLYLEPNCFTFDLVNGEDLENVHYIKENGIKIDPEDLIINRHAYKVFFKNASPNIEITSGQTSSTYYNYFIGNDVSKWASKTHAYKEVTYHHIYDGIDAKIYNSNYHLKYDFIVAKNADASKIQLQYQGLDAMYLDNESLVIKASFATLTELKPYAYQIIHGEKVDVACRFSLNNFELSFEFVNDYNHDYELVIDPELIFASYTGSPVDNWGYTATYDLDGNLYGGGIVFGSGYPTTVGAYETTFKGGTVDIALTKFSPDGSSLIYSTYLGGSSSELPHSLITTPSGELIIYGTTGSSNFPTSLGCYDNTFNGGSSITLDGILAFVGTDIFLTKLSADGGSLLSSTFIGGTSNDGINSPGGFTTEYNYGDFARGEVMLDNANNVFVASNTISSNFPITAGAAQATLAGDQDGVVFKFDPDLTTLTWSTFIGGTNEDGAYSIKINSTNEAVVCGGTVSTNFPTTAGTWHTTYQGGTTDGWVAKINSSGTSILASTFVGTNQYDQAYFTDLDNADNIYFTGQTKGSYFVSAGVYFEANGKQFITKLNSDLTSVVYSTVFGSGGSTVNIAPSAFLVDECENVYVSGWGGSVNQGYNFATGSTVGMSLTADAIQTTTDGDDFYFFVLSKNGISQLYGSYFGGPTSPEHVDGGTSRFDKSGVIYQAVCAGCWGLSDFPTTPGAWSEVNGGPLCNLGVAKIEFNLAGVYANSDAEPSIDGCVPFVVDFTNTSIGAIDYIWNFGDGTSNSILFEPTHTFTIPGSYDVMLIAIDSNSCNIADTSYLSIHVLDDSILANFDYIEIQNCDSLTATFTDLSETLGITTTYLWNFGDGTTSTNSNPIHVYAEPGEYTVLLTITDPNSCNTVDTMSITIDYLYNFNLGFTADVIGCLPIDATFTSTTTGVDDYYWNFGDGTIGNGLVVTHTYAETGIYNVWLVTTHCGIKDSSNYIVNVEGFPVAFFDSDPAFVIVNTNIQYTDLSTGSITSWSWDFGDGGTSILQNPYHIYGELGTYVICLTVVNANDCEATYCREISIEQSGIADVPSGFSPNGDGSNDFLFVRGYGIKDMDLRIFNRWGAIVFETHDYLHGWDGTYRGVNQEMEVYVYTISVLFEDNTTFNKQGNITLLR